MDSIENKTIVVLSPQPWNNLYISKHHYARALALNNKVIYISAPGNEKTNFKLEQPDAALNLFVLHWNVSIPDALRFHLNPLYKFFVKRKLLSILPKIAPQIDICFDFGSYQQYDSIRWFPAGFKIFFPVDDHETLTPQHRGADLVLSVSKNVCKKLEEAGIKCLFINHGLSAEFAKEAQQLLNEKKAWTRREKIKIGYAGNVFIPFLDIPVLQKIISEHPEAEFHFFGGTRFTAGYELHENWNTFLRSSPNVVLRGFLKPAELVAAYRDIDVFLLCYKPDYKNYHGENSHKIFEYLATGKVVVASNMSIYESNQLMTMSPKDQNESLPAILKNVLQDLEQWNTTELAAKRIYLALDNTYERHISRIAAMMRATKGISLAGA